MTQRPMNRLLDHLRQAVQTGEERLSDGELLGCFIEQRDEDCFAALLRRHGPMVLGVCRRVLGNPHDAEDAFQATFLILVRKAASVRPREAVGNWLYGVAYRTALEARTRIARRRGKEKQIQDMPDPAVEPEEHWPELQPLLDRELHRLADKYRLPVVLCDVEGRSRKEVARQLAIPEGTLSSRLATARRRLAERLARYGFVFSGASVAVLLGANAAPASVPASLSLATSKAAMLVAAGQAAAAASVVSVTVTTLTDGVLKAMLVAKFKTATLVLCGVAALSLGTGGVLYQTRAGAAGPGLPHSFQTRVARSDGAAEQQKDRGQQAAQDARDRLQALRDELAKARAVAEKQRAEAEAARAQAEEARARAERALRDARQQLQRAQKAEAAARREAEAVARNLAKDALKAKSFASRREKGEEEEETKKGVSSRNNPPSRQQGADKAGDRQRAEQLRFFLKEFETKRATMLKQYEGQRQALMRQLEQLDKEMKSMLTQLDKQRAEMEKKLSPAPANPAPAGGDKLDRILERLERMEQRLNRLERGKE